MGWEKEQCSGGRNFQQIESLWRCGKGKAVGEKMG